LSDRQTGEIPGRPRLTTYPAQRISTVAHRVFIDDRAVNGEAQFDGLRQAAFNGEGLALGFKFLPCVAVTILIPIVRIHFLHVEILLIDPNDGETEANALIVTERDAWECRLTRADRVPSRRHQMHRFAQ